MRPSKHLIVICLCFLIAWPIHQSHSYAAKLKIVTTIFPLYEMAKEVAGEKAKVYMLLPPGADPHSFEPRPSDFNKVKEAQLVLMVGAGLDNWVEDIFKALNDSSFHKKILVLSNGAPLIQTAHQHHTEIDPHIWLDFQWDIKFVQKIAQKLSEIDPANTTYFKRNSKAYIQKLKKLDASFRQILAQCSTKTFIVGGHGAFSYLARAYGLKQLSLYGLSPDERPTPKKMVELIKIMRKLGINSIFFEGGVSNKLAKVLSRETGAKIFILHAGASLTKDQLENSVTFIGLMYENLKNLSQGLGCSSSLNSHN